MTDDSQDKIKQSTASIKEPSLEDAFIELMIQALESEDIPIGAQLDTNAIATLFMQSIEAGVDPAVHHLKAGMTAMLEERRQVQIEFEQLLYEHWKSALDLFETILVVARESGESFNRKHQAQAIAGQDHVFNVLLHLHARSCLIASEVLILLKSGYASGAMSRWRTIHEIAVTAFFIKKHGAATAERYLLHNVIESARAADDYQKFYVRLGDDPIDAMQLAELRRRRAHLVKRFGKAYEGSYGWAAQALNTSNATIAAIERDVQMDHMRPYYRLASHSTHANPKGISFDLGNSRPLEQMLAGSSFVGLADPGHATLISLTQTTTALLTLFPDARVLLSCRVLDTMVKEAGDTFLAAHRENEGKSRSKNKHPNS
ncbi:MAG: DUF5677 domain-containing protein [Chloroflexota bacterium]|nr:DUF5677 domain-containing protein [Chloroflexota bacterium]